MPFLSIIVPIYKVEMYLRECIDSILSQKFIDFELILVNDGSPDKCPHICDSYAEKDKRVKVIHKENGGLVSARKAGLSIASGNYVGFVDSDDWIKPEMYSVMCATAEKYAADIVICDILKSYPDKEVRQEQIIRPGLYDKEDMMKNIYPIMLYTGEFYRFGLHPSVSNKIFRRELLKNNLYNVNDSIKLGEDVACTIPCLLDAKRVYVLEDHFVYHYRQLDLSMTNSYDTDFLEKILVLNDHLKHLIEEKNTLVPSLIEQVYYYLNYLIIATVNNELNIYNKKSTGDKIRYIKKMLQNHNINEALNSISMRRLPLKSKVYLWLLQKKQIYVLYLIIKLVRSA
jgi:glycosyltransferase involved in cell wall biosynthesis